MRSSNTLSNRYFYIAFAIAFFIFSVLFLFLVTTVHPSTPNAVSANEIARTGQDADGYVPQKEDSINVLFIGSMTGSTAAGSFILAGFDPVRGSVPIVVLPPQTLLQNGDKIETLSDVYQYGGADSARNALAVTIGVQIDRYVHMNTDVFVVCANTIGNIEYDLPHDLTVSQDGVHITLTAGKQLLDGKRVADIISYNGYRDGELERCRMIGELTAAIVNQRMDIVQSTLMDKIFEKIINLVDSDISYPDYDNRKEAALFMAGLSQNPAVAIPASGSFSDDDKTFILNDTFIALLKRTLSA